jgi:antitoxin MazE
MGASDLPVGRWGNSLAVRIPSKMARELGVEEGDTLHAVVTGSAQLTLQATVRPKMSMADFVARIQALHSRIPVTQPVVEEMRRDARY